MPLMPVVGTENLPQTACDAVADGRAAGVDLLVGTTRDEAYPFKGRPGKARKVSLPFRAATWDYVATDGKKPSNERLKKALVQHGPLYVSIRATPALRRPARAA